MPHHNLSQNIRDELERKINYWMDNMYIAEDSEGQQYDALEYAYDDGWNSIIEFVESSVKAAFYYGVGIGLNIPKKEIIDNE
jgi:hypothetical protein